MACYWCLHPAVSFWTPESYVQPFGSPPPLLGGNKAVDSEAISKDHSRHQIRKKVCTGDSGLLAPKLKQQNWFSGLTLTFPIPDSPANPSKLDSSEV